MGHEADQYGYYEEDVGGRGNEYGGGSYRMNAPQEEDRGRRASRSPGSGPGGRNPFDDDAQASLRGVSPRPIETNLKTKRPGTAGSGDSSPTERRSVFRENV